MILDCDWQWTRVRPLLGVVYKCEFATFRGMGSAACFSLQITDENDQENFGKKQSDWPL